MIKALIGIFLKIRDVFQGIMTKTFGKVLDPETGKFTGKIEILDINLSQDYISETETADFVIDTDIIKSMFKPRQDFSHKGTYGKAIITAGSYGKIGAAVLATNAALRTGAGLTFTLAPKCGYEILQTSCPEAMFMEGGLDYITNFQVDENATYGIGPGLGNEKETADAPPAA